jgi:pilus assembly protein CpaF
MNTGHDGSLATIHANTPRDALVRLETMVAMGGLSIPDKALRHQVASAIHAVVQVARLKDGSRKMLYLNEIVGMEGEVIVMQEIFRYEMQGITEEGKLKGNFKPTGIRPKFMAQLEALGVELPGKVFRETH